MPPPSLAPGEPDRHADARGGPGGRRARGAAGARSRLDLGVWPLVEPAGKVAAPPRLVAEGTEGLSVERL